MKTNCKCNLQGYYTSCALQTRTDDDAYCSGNRESCPYSINITNQPVVVLPDEISVNGEKYVRKTKEVE